MAEEWFVRVQEKEYGPVDVETLREWQSEGRLIPENPVRAASEVDWMTAREIPGLFGGADLCAKEIVESPELAQRRSFAGIVAETCRIYARGFLQFSALALLVGIPLLGFQLSFAYIHYVEGEPVSATTRIASVLAILFAAAVLVSWPIFVAGLQFAAGENAAGRPARLGEILRRAVNHWPRVARLSLLVYGSYIFWTALPLLLILTLAGVPSVWLILLALLLLAFQVYMAGRLFVNFMFWQQSSTLGGLEGAAALVESRELARSRRDAPRFQRPLWRGAILASIWLVILLLFSAALEMPFVAVRLQGITNFEQAYATMMQLAQAPTPDAMAIASTVLSSLLHTILRPLLGIAFVVLYFDAKGG
ncbi:MAG: DUF4339 domain-containing protein [Chthoniobacterales bacterium]|nr:DUF4339 domain-containing protein [Chthoniobacterales bacterium]